MTAESASDALRHAAVLHARGDAKGALASAEAALADHPSDVTVLGFLGMLQCQIGNPRRGASLLRQRLALDPGDVGARVALGRALLAIADLDAAEALCHEADVDGHAPEMLRLRADVLKARGRLPEAITIYEQLVAALPDDFAAWNNLGSARHQEGDTQGAIAAFESAAALHPALAVVQINLARALASAGRHQESIDAIDQAARLAPDNAGILRELATGLHNFGRSREALVRLAQAARLEPPDAETLVTTGLAFAQTGEFESAEQAFRAALRATPHASAYVFLGNLLEQANRIDQLEDLLREARERGVSEDAVRFLHALLLRRQGNAGEALECARSIPRGSLDDALRAQLVAQAAEDLNLVDTAFAAFEEMNRATAHSPAARRFDGTEYRREVADLARLTTPEWRATWRPASPDRSRPAPVFLVGFPRSGTTLLDTLLMGHSATHVLEEELALARVAQELGDLRRLADLGPDEIDSLRALYFGELDRLSSPPAGALIVDKMPLNCIRAPLIHRLFPDARFVFALRHPCDVVLSCFMQNFAISRAMSSFLDLGNAARFYDAVLGYWQQCGELFRLQVHTVRYEAMVDDTETEMRALTAVLGLRWEDGILDHQRTAAARGRIGTASYAQVTKGVYGGARGRWRRYQPHMRNVLPLLLPWAERLGYGSDEEGTGGKEE